MASSRFKSKKKAAGTAAPPGPASNISGDEASFALAGSRGALRALAYRLRMGRLTADETESAVRYAARVVELAGRVLAAKKSNPRLRAGVGTAIRSGLRASEFLRRVQVDVDAAAVSLAKEVRAQVHYTPGYAAQAPDVDDDAVAKPPTLRIEIAAPPAPKGRGP